jgi:hypothetical protein
MLLGGVLFFLLYFKLSDVYFSNHITFRIFHCTSLSLLSLKNTIYYGKSIIDSGSSLQTLYLSNESITLSLSNEDFYLKIIPIYFIIYIIYDLKHSYKRIDLLVHHLVCILWALINLRNNIGFLSFCVFSEGVTFAYVVPTFTNQLIYRLLFTVIFRFTIWIVMIYEKCYHLLDDDYILNIFNIIIATFMIFIDCVWFNQNYKKLKKICNRD